MGLIRYWLQGFKRPDARRPWVRAEFLALGVLLISGVAAVSWWLASQPSAPSGQSGIASSERQEYVGLWAYELTDPAQCQAPCSAEGRLAEWKAGHPSAEILEQTPVHYQGILIGYQVRYREPTAAPTP